MGQDKAMLRLGDGTLLVEHAVNTLKQIRAPFSLKEVYLSGFLSNYPCIEDVVSDKGPLGGIFSTLKSLYSKNKNTYALFIPVDMPNLEAQLLSERLFFLDIDTLVSRFAEEQFPVVIKASAEVIEFLHERIFCDKPCCSLSLASFIRELAKLNPESVLDIAAPCKFNELNNYFINTNTPGDWKAFLENYARPSAAFPAASVTITELP